MTGDYCELLSTEHEYRLLLDIVWSCNKSSSYPTLHCCQTVNTRNTRNNDIQKKLILCSLQQIRIKKLWLPHYRGKITELNQKSPTTQSPHPRRRQIWPTCFLNYHRRSRATQTQTRTLTKPVPETTLWNPHQKKKFQTKTSTRNRIQNGHWWEKWICQIKPAKSLWWK